MAAGEQYIKFAGEIVRQAQDGGIHPSVAIARLVGKRIETEFGFQPAFLVTPSAVPIEEYKPGLAITLLDNKNRVSDLRQIMPAENGGIRRIVRATDDPWFGALAVTSPNIPLQRMTIQGAGVTDANVELLNRGAAGYVGDTLYAHPIILGYASEHPEAVIGSVDVFVNDGASFRPMPEDIAGKGHYYSEVTQRPEFHIPVTGLALGALGVRPIT